MMFMIRPLVVILTGSVLLAGCTFSTADWFSDGRGAGSAPAPRSAVSAPAPAPGSAPAVTEETAPAPAGTYPYGTARSGSPGGAGAAPPIEEPAPLIPEEPEGPVLVRAPDGSVWSASGRASEEAEAAIASCYRFATARTRHDRRVTDDITRGSGNLQDRSEFGALLSNVETYDLERRQNSLFRDCMRNQGFSRG